MSTEKSGVAVVSGGGSGLPISNVVVLATKIG
jgi:hypothetical protein